ncbi:MAG TPA: carboxypeptidase [Xanthobacteraceae bacterium]|jgi:carboxypeptidase C (cathepsin A)|nr:carboxypeptidase [Xanthobacteraceae bacterium]
MTPYRVLAVALALLLAPTAFAQEHQDHRDRPERAERGSAGGEQRPHGPGLLSLLPPDSVTEHTLDADGVKLAYSATAGTLNLYEQSGERSAALFYTAYAAKGAGANRPVTFVFNGGPGAASAYLHLGLVGPKILELGPDGRDAAAARLRDNPQTWLTFTDLVLIDPIGTGWSRTAKPDNTSFFGVGPDAQVMAKAIALYVAHAGRTASPKYLLGESYGGFRALKVARALQENQGLVVSGIVMVSPMIEGALVFGGDRLALNAAVQLPSMAAAELERRHAFTPEAQAEAERFALTDYLTTLAGPAPQGEAAHAFYAKVAQMTGLPVDLVEKSRGFVREAYIKHAREAQHEIVSSYDADFAVPDPFPDSASDTGSDPILDGITRAYGGAFVGYARDELGFKTEMTYELLSHEVNNKWTWGGRRSSPDASGDLRELLALTPSFKLVVAHGYTDLIVPYAVNRYVLDHIPPIGAPGRVTLKLYRGGHMFYTNAASRIAFTADAKAFYGAPSQ